MYSYQTKLNHVSFSENFNETHQEQVIGQQLIWYLKFLTILSLQLQNTEITFCAGEVNDLVATVPENPFAADDTRTWT